MNQPDGQILVLEDDPGWQDLFREIASNLGCTVHITDNVRSGIVKLLRRLYQLVVLDLSLSPDNANDREGLKILDQLRLMNEGTQVLVVTGFANPKTVRDIFKTGEVLDFVEKTEPVSEITRKILEGVATGKHAILARSAQPNLSLKGLEPALVEQQLGVSWNTLCTLFAKMVNQASDLFNSVANSDLRDSGKQPTRDTLNYGVPRLLEHRNSAQILEKPESVIIVVRYWDRTSECPLVFRISNRKQIESEYGYFSMHSDQLAAMGFQQVSRPLYDGNAGALAYVAYETERTFEEFEFPWRQITTNLQREKF